jgi:hypothetical protein
MISRVDASDDIFGVVPAVGQQDACRNSNHTDAKSKPVLAIQAFAPHGEILNGAA